jgi:sortase A
MASSKQIPPDKNTGPAPAPAGQAAARPRRRSGRRRGSGLVIVDILIVVLVLGGLYFLLEPVVVHYLQDQMTRKLSEQYDNGEGTIFVDPDALPVSGEDVEYFDDVDGTTETTTAATTAEPSETETGTQPGNTPSPKPTRAPVRVTVKAIGRIIIPSINLNMPLAEGIEKYTLRVAPGRLIGSAGIGQPGNCVIFGHRMYTYGRHFNRLGEITIGQQIILEDKENRYVYEVDQIDTVLPDALLPELYKEVEGSRIMLVTCTPVRIASHRLLVKGKLISTSPLE